jgi:hypothetical protein
VLSWHCYYGKYHSDLNDQNSFQSTTDALPGVPGEVKNLKDQTEDHSGKLELYDSAKIKETAQNS